MRAPNTLPVLHRCAEVSRSIQTRPRNAGRRPQVFLVPAAALFLGLLAGCDVPTEPPRFDTVWESVLVRDSISTADLLPESVRAAPDGGFVVDSFTTSSEVRLEDVCEFCTCFQGPIPELEIQPYDWRFDLPSRLLEAQVSQGTARVLLHNDAGFDVLDDGEGNRGFLKIDFVDTRSGGLLDSVRVSRPFPDGDSVSVEFDLAGLTLGNSLVARVSGRTPGSGCDTVDLSGDRGFRAEVRLLDVRAPAVLVVLSDADLDLQPRDVDLPEALGRRLRPGEAEVSVDLRAEVRLPVATEVELSVARRADQLFTGEAALYTPLVLPSGTTETHGVHKVFVVDVGRLQDADHLVLDTRSHILGNRIVTLRGDESVSWSATIHAEIPTR